MQLQMPVKVWQRLLLIPFCFFCLLKDTIFLSLQGFFVLKPPWMCHALDSTSGQRQSLLLIPVRFIFVEQMPNLCTFE